MKLLCSFCQENYFGPVNASFLVYFCLVLLKSFNCTSSFSQFLDGEEENVAGDPQKAKPNNDSNGAVVGKLSDIFSAWVLIRFKNQKR